MVEAHEILSIGNVGNRKISIVLLNTNLAETVLLHRITIKGKLLQPTKNIELPGCPFSDHHSVHLTLDIFGKSTAYWIFDSNLLKSERYNTFWDKWSGVCKKNDSKTLENGGISERFICKVTYKVIFQYLNDALRKYQSIKSLESQMELQIS